MGNKFNNKIQSKKEDVDEEDGKSKDIMEVDSSLDGKFKVTRILGCPTLWKYGLC